MLTVDLKRSAPLDCPLAVPVRAGGVPTAWQAAAEAAAFTGAIDTTCDILGGTQRVLLIGVGDAADELALEAAGATAAARSLRGPKLALDLRGWPVAHATGCLTGAVERAWRYETLRSKPVENGPRLEALVGVSEDPALNAAWARQRHVLTGCGFARDLVTEPSNILTPAAFAERLGRLAEAGVQVQVLTGAALAQARLNGLIMVGQASVNPPALAILRWAGARQAAPVAFVGKGITFDTGGICIKPADHMWEMRADMAGAAACAGAMLALALRQSPVPVIALLALAENAIGGNAYRPGDILRHANGTTVEIVDTDAEGRLVLIDTLAYADASKPAAIIDLATLTGSVITALGHEMAGLFSNNDSLASAVSAAGAAVGERVWRLPIDDSHRAALESAIADLRHCSPERGQPDASQAAAFLREFVGDTPWVHLDMGGMESHEKASDRHAAGATGFGVRLLDRLIADQYE